MPAYDDGSSHVYDVDQDNAAAWSYYVNYFDTHGHFDLQTLACDNGASQSYDVDQDNTAAWSYTITYYNPGGI